MTPGPSAANTAPHSDLIESLPPVSSMSPKSIGLGTFGEAPIGGDSAQMPEEIPYERASRITDTLAMDPNIIKVGFHIKSFITTTVDTEKERTVTEALKCNLEFSSEQISVCTSSYFILPLVC
jgi:hypothetical protein